MLDSVIEQAREEEVFSREDTPTEQRVQAVFLSHKIYVWAAVDVDTFEVVHIEVSPGRSTLDVLLFLKTVLKRCHGQPVIVVDRGPWYNWALDDLNLGESRRETWEERSLVEAWFGLFKHRTRLFYSRFPSRALGDQSIAGPKPSPHSTMLPSKLDTIPLSVASSLILRA